MSFNLNESYSLSSVNLFHNHLLEISSRLESLRSCLPLYGTVILAIQLTNV